MVANLALPAVFEKREVSWRKGFASRLGQRAPKVRVTDYPRRRLLLIDLGEHFGGVENYLTHLATLVGDQLDLYALCVLPELSGRLVDVGVRVTRIPVFSGFLKPLRFVLAMLVLPWLLVRFRIDVVQVNGLLESVLMLPARLLGRRTIYTRHGPFELDQYTWWAAPQKFYPRRLAQLNLRLASHVICVSKAVEESVEPLLPRTRFSVIPNWVFPADRHPPRRDASSPVSVLCASRLEHYKGIHLLIDAATKLPQLEVTIAGEGSYRLALERLASGASNVRFVGFRRDLADLYAHADIVAMPSMGPEGLPMSSLEAMAQGGACIFSDIPVHREITDDGVGAYLFRSGDATSLYEGLKMLATQAELRSKYATDAIRIVTSRYTEASVRPAYLQAFAGRSKS